MNDSPDTVDDNRKRLIVGRYRGALSEVAGAKTEANARSVACFVAASFGVTADDVLRWNREFPA